MNILKKRLVLAVILLLICGSVGFSEDLQYFGILIRSEIPAETYYFLYEKGVYRSFTTYMKEVYFAGDGIYYAITDDWAEVGSISIFDTFTGELLHEDSYTGAEITWEGKMLFYPALRMPEWSDGPFTEWMIFDNGFVASEQDYYSEPADEYYEDYYSDEYYDEGYYEEGLGDPGAAGEEYWSVAGRVNRRDEVSVVAYPDRTMTAFTNTYDTDRRNEIKEILVKKISPYSPGRADCCFFKNL